jgi:hypothetical protein
VSRNTQGVRLAVAVLALLFVSSVGPATTHAADGGISRQDAISASNLDPKVIAERAKYPHLTPTAALIDGNWQVDYFSDGKDLVQVVVDDTTGLVRESWTGYQVAWKMARGYSGAFGHRLNAPYVWLPLCALFLAGLVDWRRRWRIANLDLLVLLSFGASHYFFNRADIGLSVPLAYPPLLYLMGRMLWVGFRGRGEGLRPVWPAAWLIIAALFLLGFRGGLNVADSGVIDVGYAGVVGADRVADGKPIYGEGAFPNDVGSGDTYGPVNYYAYVPFEQALPWSGSWDDLPAAHAAAIFFDLATFAGLVLLGRRLRPRAEGRRLGAALGFGWAAYPYAAFVLESNANDSLVAMLLVATLLVLSRPAARGATLALAGLTKFSPFILTPLLATYRADPALDDGRIGLEEGEFADAASAGGAGGGDPDRAAGRRPRTGGVLAGDRTRGLLRFGLAFIAVALLVMLQTLIDPGIVTFWHRTVASQIDRDSPFSVWGQVHSLEPLRVALMVAIGALAALVAFRPRRKSVAQVAALGAALLIGTQLIAQHWFYLYLVWFEPLILVALGTLSPGPAPTPDRSTPPAHSDLSPQPPPSPRRLPRRSRSEPASA